MVKLKRVSSARISSSGRAALGDKVKTPISLRVEARLRSPLPSHGGGDYVGGVALGGGEGWLEVAAKDDSDSLELYFSKVHRAQTSQADLFRSLGKGMADAVFSGRGGCVVALGAPGAGKTYGLMGELGEYGRMGLVPRLISEILERLGRRP